MPDVSIVIPAPVLISGQYFKVEYRLKGSPVWILVGNRSNAAFTLSVPSEGVYELRTTFFNGTVFCDAVVQEFPVIPEYECTDFVVTLEEDNGIYFVRITYSIPSPFVYPPCGWRITIMQGTSIQSIPYPAGLPLSGIIEIVVPANAATSVEIDMNLCGAIKSCYAESLAPISVPCTGFTAVVGTMLNSSGWNLVINFNQSIPMTALTTWTYKQVGYVAPGAGALDQGSWSIPLVSSGTQQITTKVFPNPNVEPHFVQYEGTITDRCGNSHYFITPQYAF